MDDVCRKYGSHCDAIREETRKKEYLVAAAQTLLCAMRKADTNTDAKLTVAEFKQAVHEVNKVQLNVLLFNQSLNLAKSTSDKEKYYL